jgi:hypothetical protein
LPRKQVVLPRTNTFSGDHQIAPAVLGCTIDKQQGALPGKPLAKTSKIWKYSVSAAGMIKQQQAPSFGLTAP